MRRTEWVMGIFTAVLLMSPVRTASAAVTTGDLNAKLASASTVFHELLTTPDRGVPERLLGDCRCVAVLPHVISGAFVYGARAGSGVMSCRDSTGTWSPPSFINLKGGSLGAQIGGEASDLVLFFMTERGARSLMTGSQFTLGGSATVAAGPVGRTGEASTDVKLTAEIYTYARSKGLFAGVSVAGARLVADETSNALYYGGPVSVKALLFEHHAIKVPAGAEIFRRALP